MLALKCKIQQQHVDPPGVFSLRMSREGYQYSPWLGYLTILFEDRSSLAMCQNCLHISSALLLFNITVFTSCLVATIFHSCPLRFFFRFSISIHMPLDLSLDASFTQINFLKLHLTLLRTLKYPLVIPFTKLLA